MNDKDDKVDKLLVKNLIIGFISSNNNMNKDQMQILKLLASVLDFTKDETSKVTHGKPLSSKDTNSSQINHESLSHAFVRFLENESRPREIPNLLETAVLVPLDTPRPSSSGSRTSPAVLNEVVLPTFLDFSKNRNSSSILKDVLKDNN